MHVLRGSLMRRFTTLGWRLCNCMRRIRFRDVHQVVPCPLGVVVVVVEQVTLCSKFSLGLLDLLAGLVFLPRTLLKLFPIGDDFVLTLSIHSCIMFGINGKHVVHTSRLFV